MKKCLLIIMAIILLTSTLAACRAPMIKGNVPQTSDFCKTLAEQYTGKIAEVYSYNQYEPVYGSPFFNLEYTSVLYSDGVVFAVVNTRQYPEYAEEGPATMHDTKKKCDIELMVVQNNFLDYALLYMTGEEEAQPSEELLYTFQELQQPEKTKEEEDLGKLIDFYYHYGSWTWETYELMDLSMVETDSNGKALAYSGVLKDVLEVSVTELSELEEIVEKYHLHSWEGEYKGKDVTDGYGYTLVMRYENGTITSSGYMDYPDGYEEGHQAIVDFFNNVGKEEQEKAKEK